MGDTSVKSSKSGKAGASRKPAGKPVVSRKRTAKRGNPSHEAIAERAYYLHLEEHGRGELENWLSAERQLAGD